MKKENAIVTQTVPPLASDDCSHQPPSIGTMFPIRRFIIG
jgi:hypothetical protein